MIICTWGLGIGDWGLGIGPQAPSPNPKPPKLNFYKFLIIKIIN